MPDIDFLVLLFGGMVRVVGAFDSAGFVVCREWLPDLGFMDGDIVCWHGFVGLQSLGLLLV